MADEDRTERDEEGSAGADAARAESDPSSVVEPSDDELTADDAADEDFAADLRDDSDTDPDYVQPDFGVGRRDEGDDESDPVADGDGDRVPEPVGAAAGAAATKSSGRAARTAESGKEPGKKDRPTPKRDGDAAAPRRTGPITFVKESVAELRKVVYPTGPQLANYFVVVLIFVLVIIAYVSLLDLGFGAAMFRIFS